MLQEVCWIVESECSDTANGFPASCPALRPNTDVLKLMESKPGSEQGAGLRAGQTSSVRQVYVQSWQLRKPTGEPVETSRCRHTALGLSGNNIS